MTTLLISPPRSLAQSAYHLEQYNTSNGFPQNNITAMAFDEPGYLWIATSQGLVRYDGASFKSYLPVRDTTGNVYNNIVIDISDTVVDSLLLIRMRSSLIYTIRYQRPVLYSSVTLSNKGNPSYDGYFPSLALFNQFNLARPKLAEDFKWNSDIRATLPVNSHDFIVLGENLQTFLYYHDSTKQKEIRTAESFMQFLKAGNNNLMADDKKKLHLFDTATKKFIPLLFDLPGFPAIAGTTPDYTYLWDRQNNESYCFAGNSCFQLLIDSTRRRVKPIHRFSIDAERHVFSSIVYHPVTGSYFLGSFTEGLYIIKPGQTENLGVNKGAIYDLLGKIISIDKIQVDDKVIDSVYENRLYAASNTNFIGLELSIPYFGNAEKLSIEYSIDNTGWQKLPQSATKKILLYQLAGGDHTISIRARAGNETDKYVYSNFIIHKQKKIFERPWFYPVLAVILLLSILVISKIRTSRINMQRQQLKALVKEQTSELSKNIDTMELLMKAMDDKMITPLKQVQSTVEQLKTSDYQEANETFKKGLSSVRNRAGKIVAGSQGIINYLKYNSGKTVLDLQFLNLYDTVDEICSAFQQPAENKKVELENTIPDFIYADIDLPIFSIIISNIIANVIEHSNANKLQLFAKPMQDPHSEIVLKISDNGTGINSIVLEQIQKIIKGNTEAQLSGDDQNIGLGYILIGELAKIHQLKIWVNSEVEKGTVVSIVFPPKTETEGSCE